eukprot:TRINITY_DN3556_c0_g1_i1.p2 TRINITY_DN3556_c0_g1~~TRINITY_DN3556_c0_g1_i1.p2  ORF type:complete len:179 (-),score=68.07 TRINITY_DN3556_c0_g1_i1:251-787(-)
MGIKAFEKRDDEESEELFDMFVHFVYLLWSVGELIDSSYLHFFTSKFDILDPSTQILLLETLPSSEMKKNFCFRVIKEYYSPPGLGKQKIKSDYNLNNLFKFKATKNKNYSFELLFYLVTHLWLSIEKIGLFEELSGGFEKKDLKNFVLNFGVEECDSEIKKEFYINGLEKIFMKKTK